MIMDQIDEVIKMLDAMTQAEVSRIKIQSSEEEQQGEVKKSYHHGRCDVGSPFASGKLYDFEGESGCE